MTARKARQAREDGAVLVDVREPDEWSAGHAADAIHIPLAQLTEHVAELPADREIITVCRSGRRSATAATLLNRHLLIGVLLGLLGGGGSILAVPALVYGASMPLSAAIPTSLIVVGTSSAIAVLPRLKQIRWRLAVVFAGAGSAAAFAGAAVNRLLPPTLVMLGFAALMVGAGVQMLRTPGTV